jgi:hypothetical protein
VDTDNELDPEDLLFSGRADATVDATVKAEAGEEGWEPVDDAWAPPAEVADLESFLQEEPGFGESPRHEIPLADEPVRRNLLPDDDVPAATAAGKTPGLEPGRRNPKSDVAPAAVCAPRPEYAALGSAPQYDGPRGVVEESATGESYAPWAGDSRLRSGHLPGHGEVRDPSAPREALPTAKDAPQHRLGLYEEPQPWAWIIPGVTVAFGVTAGVYMCAERSTVILGAIVIAVSVVGGLMLRLLLRK